MLLARTAADPRVVLAEGMVAAAALDEGVALIEEAPVNVRRGHEVREDHTLVELQHVVAAKVVDRRVSAVHSADNLVHQQPTIKTRTNRVPAQWSWRSH